MKKLLFALLTIATINCFAIDFSYAMTAEQAAQFIEENKDINEQLKNDANVIIDLNNDKTFDEIVNKVDIESVARALFQISVNNGQLKDKAYTMIEPYILEGSPIVNTQYFKNYAISRAYFYDTAVCIKLRSIYTKDQVRAALYESILININYSAKAKNTNYIIHTLNINVKAYEEIYLDTDIEAAKAELKKLNAKAYVLVDNDNFKEIVVKLRKLYKSLDI